MLHLRKVCRNLKELDLARCKSVTTVSVRRLFDSCPSLESLNLSFLEAVADEAFEASRGVVFVCAGGKRVLAVVVDGYSGWVSLCFEPPHVWYHLVRDA